MSWFGNHEKDNLLYEMNEFLKEHSISELLQIVEVAVEVKEQDT